MLTRCPHCQTVFRASQVQLTTHHGQVRCGACYHPFNAHAHLVKEDEDIFLFAWQEEELHSIPPPATPEIPYPAESPFPEVLPQTPLPPEPLPAKTPLPETLSPKTQHVVSASLSANETLYPEEDDAITIVPSLDSTDELLLAQIEERAPPESPKTRAEKTQTAEEIRQHGLETGMIAARRQEELPDFSTWSEPPLDADLPTYTRWPFTMAIVFFAFLLATQVVFHFRSEISHNSPAFTNLFRALEVDIPVARESEYLTIDGSELQTLEDPDRLRLFATLRNKAPYALAWPHLEVSLTDAYNTVLVRKIFSPDEYLTRTQASGAFASGDAMVQLDLGARAIAPAGYNLYLFYP